MWRSIADMKNSYQDRDLVIVGTGPSADNLDGLLHQKKNPVLIAINRALVLHNTFEFLFVDHPETLMALEPYMKNTKYVAMPWWSRSTVNMNHSVAMKYREKLLLYSWVYEIPQILTAPDYSLNDVNLHISWGNVQSAIHFAKLIGATHVTMIGCDGSEVKGRYYATKVAQCYPEYQSVTRERKKQYKNSNNKIPEIASRLGVSFEHYSFQ